MMPLASYSTETIVHELFPRVLQSVTGMQLLGDDDAEPVITEPQQAVGGLLIAERNMKMALGRVDRGEPPANVQPQFMRVLAILGSVHSWLLSRGLAHVGGLGDMVLLLIDRTNRAIVLVATSMAAAIKAFSGYQPKDFLDWLSGKFNELSDLGKFAVVASAVVAGGWVYTLAATSGGQSFLISAGRGNLAVMGASARGVGAISGATARAVPAVAGGVVKLIPSLTTLLG